MNLSASYHGEQFHDEPANVEATYAVTMLLEKVGISANIYGERLSCTYVGRKNIYIIICLKRSNCQPLNCGYFFLFKETTTGYN